MLAKLKPLIDMNAKERENENVREAADRLGFDVDQIIEELDYSGCYRLLETMNGALVPYVLTFIVLGAELYQTEQELKAMPQI